MTNSAEFNVSYGDLVYDQWRFELIGNKLVLDNYTRYLRKTKRHNWIPIKNYSRLSNLPTTFYLTLDEVPYDKSIEDLALETLMNQIKVVTEL